MIPAQASLARTVHSLGRTVASLVLTVFAGPHAILERTMPKPFPTKSLPLPLRSRSHLHGDREAQVL